MINKVYLDSEKLESILSKINDVKVCTIGDVCLDFYIFADMKLSKLSRETPHYPLPVVKEVTSPGGGGNVVNNINDLGVKELKPVSAMGNDWRGFLLEKYFSDNNINSGYILKSDNIITNCYCKPMRMGISNVIYEDPRLDFENRNRLNSEDEEKILNNLKNAASDCDIIAVSDQMDNGIITPKIRDYISELAEKIPVIVDSRERAGLYKNVIVKPNEVEAAFMIGKDITGLDLSTEELAEIGSDLQSKNNCPVIVTLGERGSLWCDKGEVYLAPTIKAEPPIDIVGAGDTFLSAFVCAYATGATGPDSLAFANLASGVTVKKIGTTGTASKEEIRAKFKENSNKW